MNRTQWNTGIDLESGGLSLSFILLLRAGNLLIAMCQVCSKGLILLTSPVLRIPFGRRHCDYPYLTGKTTEALRIMKLPGVKQPSK